MSPTKWTYVMAGVVFILALLAIEQASQAPAVSFDSLGSATVPYMVAAALLLLSCLMVLEELMSAKLPADEAGNVSAMARQLGMPIVLRTTICLIAFVAYVTALHLTAVPFWTVTLPFVYLCSRVLEGGAGHGRLASLILACIVAVGVQWTFTGLLLIDLP